MKKTKWLQIRLSDAQFLELEKITRKKGLSKAYYVLKKLGLLGI